jgi:hypothetical protein
MRVAGFRCEDCSKFDLTIEVLTFGSERRAGGMYKTALLGYTHEVLRRVFERSGGSSVVG